MNKKISNLAKHIEKTLEILENQIGKSDLVWGMYLGDIKKSRYLLHIEQLFKIIGSPNFIEVDVPIKSIMVNTIEYILNKLNNIKTYLERELGEITTLINIKFSLAEDNNLSMESFFYYNFFILRLFIHSRINMYKINISELSYNSEMIHQKYFTNDVGIFITPYYLIKFIDKLYRNVVKNDIGILATRSENNFRILLYEDYNIYLKNSINSDYTKKDKEITLKIDNIAGTYKVTEYRLDWKIEYLAREKFDENLFMTLTKDERKYLSAKYMPDIHIEFKTWEELRNYKITRKPLEILLIDIKRVE